MTNAQAKVALDTIIDGMATTLAPVEGTASAQGIADIIEKAKVVREVVSQLAETFGFAESKILRILYFIFKQVEDYGPIAESMVNDIVQKIVDFKHTLGLE